jgi:shikimate dehydrogenase
VADALTGVRGLGLEGLNVTMPHKATVAAEVDRLSPAAEALAAVNTVVRRGDELVGDNTDGAGFVDSLRIDHGFEPEGRRCLVVGAGGAGRAVVLALAGAGASEIIVVNRSPERAGQAVALAGRVGRAGTADEAGDVDLVVNATPLGMSHAGDEAALPVDPDRLGPDQVVVDLVYDPPLTPLLQAARTRGATAVNGIGMLIHQAGHAFRLWTAEPPPLEAMSAAAVAELAARRGGPGPGPGPRTATEKD